MNLILTPLEIAGKHIINFANAIGNMFVITQRTARWFLLKGMDRRNVFDQMMEMGTKSLAVTGLTALFSGMVLALQTGYSFRKVFNEPLYIGMVVGFSLMKELGPVLTALVIAGRVGAAIAAEVGTMQVTEQIDALYTLGTNPIRYLAVPRFIAALTMVPLLTVYADFFGVLGGYFVAVNRLRVPSSVYWDEIYSVSVSDCAHGLIKSVVFALIIVATACYKGFTCTGGAEGVGKATTSAVVIAMVTVLIGDYFLSALLVSFGIG